MPSISNCLRENKIAESTEPCGETQIVCSSVNTKIILPMKKAGSNSTLSFYRYGRDRQADILIFYRCGRKAGVGARFFFISITSYFT
ncbi:hypothetical protein Bhyg_05328 [Pseudolycoriella hygida]|uniref:Uncharacterized protein n=1 Tax=Pseudolycoriella hygida TaxID=35572 RepID=A0A9Q0NGW4_9DIPT|nr:hypothetical protein Bhyg_05328 [Pseudolycoriella hygida]